MVMITSGSANPSCSGAWSPKEAIILSAKALVCQLHSTSVAANKYFSTSLTAFADMFLQIWETAFSASARTAACLLPAAWRANERFAQRYGSAIGMQSFANADRTNNRYKTKLRYFNNLQIKLTGKQGGRRSGIFALANIREFVAKPSYKISQEFPSVRRFHKLHNTRSIVTLHQVLQRIQFNYKWRHCFFFGISFKTKNIFIYKISNPQCRSVSATSYFSGCFTWSVHFAFKEISRRS